MGASEFPIKGRASQVNLRISSHPGVKKSLCGDPSLPNSWETRRLYYSLVFVAGCGHRHAVVSRIGQVRSPRVRGAFVSVYQPRPCGFQLFGEAASDHVTLFDVAQVGDSMRQRSRA